MIYAHDSYVSNLLPTRDAERIRAVLDRVSSQQLARGFYFPPGSAFQTVAELRQSLASTGVSRYVTVSLSTRFRPGPEYLFLDGWRAVPESSAAEFFRLTNLAMLDANPRPPGELWYAMVSGHFPHLLIDPLREHRALFQAVKVGSSRPIPLSDPRFEPLWQWCAAECLPVLLHCSGENPEDFSDGLQICRRHPSLSVTLSHLGGMLQAVENPLDRNREILIRRAAILRRGLPPNLTFNNAIYDLALTDLFCDAFPSLESRILSALDLPFFGAIPDRLAKLRALRCWPSIEANTAAYLGTGTEIAAGIRQTLFPSGSKP